MFNRDKKNVSPCDKKGVLFSIVENLNPKWCKVCYKSGKYQIQLKMNKHSYHYAEGNNLEELLKNLCMRLEKFAIDG